MIGNSAVKRLNALRETDFREELCVGCVRFDNIDHLALLSADDLLTFRLYANNDSANVLWEFGVQSKELTVSYALPTPEGEVKHDTTALFTNDPYDMRAYRTLGGVRLKLEYHVKPGETLKSWKWDLPPVGTAEEVQSDLENRIGCFKNYNMLDAGGSKLQEAGKCDESLDQDLSANAVRLYWQPAWASTTIETKLHVEFIKANGESVSKDIPVRFARQELIPDNTHPMIGSDVEMLEQMLWQLGISPQYGFPGKGGTRINAIAETELKKPRNVYSAGWNSNFALKTKDAEGHDIVANITAKRTASVEMMVRRFQGHSFSSVNNDDAQAGKYQTGTVEESILQQLAKVWRDYQSATEQFVNKAQINFATLDGLKWWGDMEAALDGSVTFNGKPNANTLPVTYTQTKHKSMLTSLGLEETAKTRQDVMKAWVAQESSGLYWGGGDPRTSFRMTEGSADERGSMGYDQILFQYVYGANSCAGVKDINLYHPRNNLLGFIAYASSTARNCGSSFTRMFTEHEDSWAIKFDNTNNGLGATLVGYGYYDEATQKIAYTKKGTEALTADDYERLTKGLAGYNGDKVRVMKCSLADVVTGVKKSVLNSPKNCASPFVGARDIFKQYAMEILHDGNSGNQKLKLPYRKYVWKVEAQAGAYCFAFGEEEWRFGVTIQGQRYTNFNDIYEKADDGLYAHTTCP